MQSPATEQPHQYWFARHSKPIVFLIGILTVIGLYESSTIPVAVFPTTNFPRMIVGVENGVMPIEQMEEIPLRPPSERAAPVVASKAGVEQRTIGEGGHRTRIPVEVQPLSAGIKGGIVGGAAMAVVALLYGLLFERSIWYLKLDHWK